MIINKNFTLVLIGQIISLFGNAIQRVAISLYLLELTGSAGVYSGILALSILPFIFLAPFAGKAADTFSRKNIMIVLDITAGIILLIYFGCFFVGFESSFLASIVLLSLSCISACYNPAVTSCLPQIIDSKKLQTANSYINQVGAWSNIIGPLLAGVFYGLLGIRFIILINSISFIFSSFLEFFIDLPKPNYRVKKFSFEIKNTYMHMVNTLSIIKKQYKVIFGIILSYGLFNICVFPVNSILFPSVMKLEFKVSSETFGFLEGIITIGLLLSGILVRLRPKWFPFISVYRWNYPMPTIIFFMGIAMISPISVYLKIFIMSLGGLVILFCLGVGNIITLSYIQSTIPTKMLGSVSALSIAFATATIPVGQILFGNMIEGKMQIGHILLLASIVSLVVSLYVRNNILKNVK